MSGTKRVPSPHEQVALLKASVEEWNNLREEVTFRPSLRGARLKGAALNGANLVKANLRGADLTEANLALADLSFSFLIRTQLKRADLKGANLKHADLLFADLTDADLTSTELMTARLGFSVVKRANFSFSRVAGTSFSALDMSDAVGLDAIHHVGPSSVGIDTLYSSGGKIPDVFLRSAGVEENLIELSQSLIAPSAIEFYSAFISYSHAKGKGAEDHSFATRLHDQLQGKGIRCWRDEHQILAGDDIYKSVFEGIRLWDKMLLCCSEDSLQSWWVEREIDQAIAKEKSLRDQTGKDIASPL